MLLFIFWFTFLFGPIEWSERPLSLTDFKGSSSEYTASACTEILLTRQIKGGIFTYEVKALFHPDKSYFSKNTLNPIYILEHEQLHFDITEYYARLLEERIEPYQKTHENYDKVIKIFEQTTYEWNVAQDQYDFETDHGTDALAQKKWRQRIDAKGVCH